MDKEKIREEANAMFAKIYLVNDNPSEAESDRVLLDWILGIGGSFYTKIIDAMGSAHHIYKEQLVRAFPELKSVFRYMTEPGYWEDFRRKYM